MVWENDSKASRLLALCKVSVGAINLGSINTQYELKIAFCAELFGEIKSRLFIWLS